MPFGATDARKHLSAGHQTQTLIPKMHFLSLSSLHRFTDGTYWDFVSSRVVAARNGDIGCSILSSDASAVAYANFH
jgi:hypothetical protein